MINFVGRWLCIAVGVFFTAHVLLFLARLHWGHFG